MKKKLLIMNILGICLILSLSSCQPEEDQATREELIQQAFQERIEKYKAEHAKNCHKKIMTQAKIIADSTLLANARNIKVVDSTSRPPKPIKPGLPDPQTLEDTFEIAPFLVPESTDSLPLN